MKKLLFLFAAALGALPLAGCNSNGTPIVRRIDTSRAGTATPTPEPTSIHVSPNAPATPATPAAPAAPSGQ